MFSTYKESAFFTLVHLTDKGYEMAAEEISKNILPHVRNKLNSI